MTQLKTAMTHLETAVWFLIKKYCKRAALASPTACPNRSLRTQIKLQDGRRLQQTRFVELCPAAVVTLHHLTRAQKEYSSSCPKLCRKVL